MSNREERWEALRMYLWPAGAPPEAASSWAGDGAEPSPSDADELQQRGQEMQSRGEELALKGAELQLRGQELQLAGEEL
ncbi:hypothetical protein EMIHUDRAFT_259720, partial [Emiliania huxleyi CCMP1516]